MAPFMWSILYGPYDMVHIISIGLEMITGPLLDHAMRPPLQPSLDEKVLVPV